MKATVSQSDLARGLSQVSRALSSRVQLPVLNNVLVEAVKGGVTLSATNLEIGIRTHIGGKVTAEGALTVPARSWTEFVTSLSGDNLELEDNEMKLKVKAGKYQATFSGVDASEFPVLPVHGSAGQAISSQLLGQIASQVAYAAATDESRPVLTGIKFQRSGDNLAVVATDGFRLSRKLIPLDPKLAGLITDLILPARTISEVARIASESKEDQVTIESVIKNNQVIFSCAGTDLISRVLEGNYPDVEKIIPSDLPVEAILDRQEFTRSLKAASIFARENNNIVRFKITDAKFNISAQAAQAGESEIEIEAETTGEGEIAFNYKFVADVLGSLTSERVRLQVKDHLSPGVFRPEKDDSLLALVMPVRI
ncbi:MAG: DNA polymerase III subunit beta [bacterium]|nr:DNA polymerase III subunit beta [bacterium]